MIPDSEHRGKFRTWDAHGNPSGFSDVPQYNGQCAIRFPLDWTPFQCFMRKHEANEWELVK